MHPDERGSASANLIVIKDCFDPERNLHTRI